jgi:hypothetical protein
MLQKTVGFRAHGRTASAKGPTPTQNVLSLPDEKFTQGMRETSRVADTLNVTELYVDPDMETTDAIDNNEVNRVSSLYDASDELQLRFKQAEDRLRTTLPARRRPDRLEPTARAQTQEELKARFARWTFNTSMVIKPLYLFSTNGLSESESRLMTERQSTLMGGLSYACTENILIDIIVEDKPREKIAEFLREKLRRYFDIVMIDGSRLAPTANQKTNHARDWVFVAWLSLEKFGHAMLCTILNKEETMLIGYFWIPPITLEPVVAEKKK